MTRLRNSSSTTRTSTPKSFHLFPYHLPAIQRQRHMNAHSTVSPDQQTNKQTWTVFRSKMADGTGLIIYLSKYLQQQHIYHHYLYSSSRFTYVLKKWHYGNKWRNWEALTKIYFWQIGSCSNYTLKALKTIIEICSCNGSFSFDLILKSAPLHILLKSRVYSSRNLNI